ncbi:MAG: hypothetical protein Q8910_00240 [Bacteroidota bacterium]|nr:hypothetical protein [Bacteroidota bacterium]
MGELLTINGKGIVFDNVEMVFGVCLDNVIHRKMGADTNWNVINILVEESLNFNNKKIGKRMKNKINKKTKILYSEMRAKIEAIEDEYQKVFDQFLDENGLDSGMGMIDIKKVP